jgi:PAS domain S-box-containing protein
MGFESDDPVSARPARPSSPGWDLAHDPATFFAVSIDLLVIRDQDRRIVNANPAWERVLGYSPAELIGTSMLDYIHPEDLAPSVGHMLRMDLEEEVDGFINRYRRRDETYRHLEWRARRVGELVYGVARDVTDRIAVEAQMAAAKAAAEAANRAKSDFLANMSHEIRTPLNGVIGVVSALARTELTPLQRDMVELVATSGETLERLVADVLDFSKIEAGRLELESCVFDLDEQLDGPLALFRLKAQEKGLRFVARKGDTARGEFVGDAVRLKQVLGNLLSNAVKFTTDGEIQVSADVCEGQGGDPCVLRLQVKDTGVGFAEGFAEDIFQRFTQADGAVTRRFGGTGLGLSISRALVEKMGGDIIAHSEPGRGSVFHVVVPLARHGALADYDQRAAQGAAPVAPEAVLQDRRSLRVLLAEDHPVNQRVVQLMLAPLGTEVVTVEDGAAVEAFRGGPFDVVLMDMQMPVMDGLSAMRAIRALEAAGGARTPIIMLSANAFEQHRVEATEAGADVYLAKPVTGEALLNGIADALEIGERR